jgi:hypothetical protein
MAVSRHILSNLCVEHLIVNPQKVGSKPASHSGPGEGGGKNIFGSENCKHFRNELKTFPPLLKSIFKITQTL